MSYNGREFWEAAVTLSASAQQYQSAAAITNPYAGNSVDLTIFVSCYNEEIFIVDTLRTIVEAMKAVGRSYEILVIDDGSKDRSAELVSRFIEAHPEINIILRSNKKNKGLAQNYFDGAYIGRGTYYRLICGDNAEPMETIVDVCRAIGEADIIVPYYVSAVGKSAKRKFISKFYTFIINTITGHRINYYNGLQVHLRQNVMRWHPQTRGFGFQADLLCQLLDLGFTYKQVPCRTIERRGGAGNAITWKNLLSVAHTILEILLRRIANRVYRKK